MSFHSRIRQVLAFPVPAAAIAILVAVIVWTRPPTALPAIGQVQSLLPPGSILHSLARLEMNGQPPQEVAVVAGVPLYPRSPDFTYYAFVLAYDRWRHQYLRVYMQPLLASLPLSVDAARVLGNREAAVFTALHEDGTRSYQVVGMVGGTVRVVRENRVSGRIIVTDMGLVEEEAPARRLFVWDGREFHERPAPANFQVWPSLTWHYGIRNGAVVVARTATIHVHARQALRLAGSGGGPTPIIIADSRLDVVENGGYRARIPGTYRIRILIPYLSDDQAYVLTVLVDGENPLPP